MAKRIAVLSYHQAGSQLQADAAAVRGHLAGAGYIATLVDQWRLNEPDQAMFFSAAEWTKLYDGVVICDFYGSWNLRELILSRLPVICLNVGYADDLGLGEEGAVTHTPETECTLVVNTHPITAALALGAHNIGPAVWVDTISTVDHYVEVLAVTPANNPAIVVHKTHKLVYFGWYTMSSAAPGSLLFTLLVRAAQWAF